MCTQSLSSDFPLPLVTIYPHYEPVNVVTVKSAYKTRFLPMGRWLPSIYLLCTGPWAKLNKFIWAPCLTFLKLKLWACIPIRKFLFTFCKKKILSYTCFPKQFHVYLNVYRLRFLTPPLLIPLYFLFCCFRADSHTYCQFDHLETQINEFQLLSIQVSHKSGFICHLLGNYFFYYQTGYSKLNGGSAKLPELSL